MAIEVEIRSFISEEEYNRLLEFFRENADISSEDHQETHYFDGPHDIRIQQNDEYSKIWMKKGELHDDAREEIEVKCHRDEFPALQQLFEALGYKVKIKWFRTRNTFFWKDITVCVDFTKGYGHILELERLTSEQEKEQALAELKARIGELGIAPTLKDEFRKRFEYYEQHWQELI